MPAAPAVCQPGSTFSQRAQFLLNSYPSTAAGLEAYSVQTQIWGAQSLYMKGIDSEGKNLLVNALPQVHSATNEGDDSFSLLATVDVMERWSSHFTPSPDPNPAVSLPALVQSTLTGYPYWEQDSATSNQQLMFATARYLSYEKYPTATFASTFSPTDPNGYNYLICIMTQFATHNLQEYDSNVYTGPYLASFRLLADYAQNPTIKNNAQLMYDWLLANSASTWMNSTWAATSYRRYFEIAPQNMPETGSGSLWPLFGGPALGSGFSITQTQYGLQTIATCACVTGYVKEDGAASTAYKPRQELMDLLAWSTTTNAPTSYQFEARTYTPSSPTYQYMQQSYITANYALFGEADYNTASAAKIALQPPSQQLSGIVWNPSTANAAFPSLLEAGAPRWQVDTTNTGVTGCPTNSYDCAVANHTFGYGQHGQYFQNGNAQIGVYDYNIATIAPEPNQFYIYAPLCTANQYPWDFTKGNIPNFPCASAIVPRAMITSEASTLGHLYLLYDNVLISLWLSAPFTWDGLHELSTYDPSTMSTNLLLASAIEVASPSQFLGTTDAATLANFQKFMDAHASLNTTGLYGSSPSATYTTSSGVVLENVFQGNNYLNGTAVNYANWPLMQTSWVQQSWLNTVACVSCYNTMQKTYTGIGGGGNLTVTSPVTGNELIYNFNTWTVTEMLAQTISFATLATPATVGSTASLSATATSGLPVTYTVVGPATINGTTLTYTGSGSVTVTASQAGSSTYLPASIAQVIIVVNASTTTLQASSQTVTAGNTVKLTATVTPTAGTAVLTGSVTFYDGGVSLGSVQLSGNTANLITPALTAGTHSFTAIYSGDANYAASMSSTTQVVVSLVPTTLVVSSSSSSGIRGASITFTAMLTPSSGSVNEPIMFYDGATPLGTGNLNASGSATYISSTLAIGTHQISAQYAGDATYAGSASATTQVIITGDPTSLSLQTSTTTAAFGTSVTLAATVTHSAGTAQPTGLVTFYDGVTQIGSAQPGTSGIAAFPTSTLAVGAHTLTAQFAGDANYAASASTGVQVIITALPTTVSLTASPTTVVVGNYVALTASVAQSSGSTIPQGTITFLDGANSLGLQSTNASGIARLSVTTLAIGTHSITAQYTANGSFAGSTSADITVVVTAAPDYSLHAASSSLTVSPGSSVSTSVTITPLNNYTGTVSFTCGSGIPSSLVCSISPTATSILTTNQAVQSVNVTFTAAASSGQLRDSPVSGGIPFLGFTALLPAAFLCLYLRSRSSSHVRSHRLLALLAGIACVGLLGLSGCAAAKTSNNGTGTYQALISSSDGTNSHSISITVNVQ